MSVIEKYKKQLDPRYATMNIEIADFKKLLAVMEAAEEYEEHLPNMELVGAAKYSSQLRKAVELRKALAALRMD